MSYIIVSGESPRSVMVDVVETETEIADAVARAVYGTTADALAEPVAHRDMVAELIENEELRFEDGFVLLYRGGLHQPHKSWGCPEGWRLVPIEPTTGMLMAGKLGDTVKERYQAQLAAAPSFENKPDCSERPKWAEGCGQYPHCPCNETRNCTEREER